MTPTLLVVACALTSTLASDASWFRKPGGAVMDVDRIRAASLLKKGRSLRDVENGERGDASVRGDECPDPDCVCCFRSSE